MVPLDETQNFPLDCGYVVMCPHGVNDVVSTDRCYVILLIMISMFFMWNISLI